MDNKQFDEEFIKKYNSELQEYLRSVVSEKGALCLPFIHYDEEHDTLQDGWENVDHTHFDVRVDGKMYHGILAQVRKFIGETDGTHTLTDERPDEIWTEIGLENEKERNYYTNIWIDDAGKNGEYVNIQLTDDTIDLLNDLYDSRKIFTGEDPREFYNSATLTNMGYSVSEIAEDIEPREGEIEEVIRETNELAKQNDKEETIDQDGQTQADE